MIQAKSMSAQVAPAKKAARVAPAKKAARVKAESKAKPTRPKNDARRRAIESDAPTAVPISASPRQPRGPPLRKFHFDKRIDSIVSAPGGDDDLLTAAEVAAWLGVSVQWVDIGRSEGYGPPFQKLGDRLVRYHRAKVKAWLLARTHYSTSEYAR
jgi:predicted DNA-binding transcriptional regulator AlpA